MGVSLGMTVDGFAVLCPAAWEGPAWRPWSPPDLRPVLQTSGQSSSPRQTSSVPVGND